MKKANFQCACKNPSVFICPDHVSEHLSIKASHVITPIEAIEDYQHVRNELEEIQGKVIEKFMREILQIKLKAADAIKKMNQITERFKFKVSTENRDPEILARLVEELKGLEFIDLSMLSGLKNNLLQDFQTENQVHQCEVVNGMGEEKGKFIFEDGSVYIGDWKYKKMHGKGTLRYSSGDVYRGDFFKGRKHGQGNLSRANGDMYEGQFNNDIIQGLGKYIYADGDFYNGQWKEWVFDGKGTMTYKNGEIYIGQFRNGQKHGPGLYYLTNGKTIRQLWEKDSLKIN